MGVSSIAHSKKQLEMYCRFDASTWWAECCRPVSAPLQTVAAMRPARNRRLLSFASDSGGCNPSHPTGERRRRFRSKLKRKLARMSVSVAVNLQVGCCPAAGLPGSASEQGKLVSLWVRPASRPA